MDKEKILSELDLIISNSNEIDRLETEIDDLKKDCINECKILDKVYDKKLLQSIKAFNTQANIELPMMSGFENVIKNAKCSSFEDAMRLLDETDPDNGSSLDKYLSFDFKYEQHQCDLEKLKEQNIIECKEEKESTKKQYQSLISGARSQIKKLKASMKKLGVLDESYIFLAKDVRRILKTNRADDFVSALNLAVSEYNTQVYREQQLAIQEEAAYNQAEILREQADEERRNHESMERIAREEAEYRNEILQHISDVQDEQLTMAQLAREEAEEQEDRRRRVANERSIAFDAAAAKYEVAARQYEEAVNNGNKASAESARRVMAEAEADMLRNK